MLVCSISQRARRALGEVMIESATATDTFDASIPSVYTASINEVLTAIDTLSASSAAFATFDGVPTGAVVVSNGGLTVTHGSLAASVGVASTAQKSTGKFYFELTSQVSFHSGNGFGILLSTGAIADGAAGTNCTEVSMSPGSIFSNNAGTGKSVGAQSVGDVFALAVDLGAHLAWFRRNNGNWNGDATANPATTAGGVTVAAGSFAPFCLFGGVSGSTADAYTANFGASAFSGAVPSGFTAGWPA